MSSNQELITINEKLINNDNQIDNLVNNEEESFMDVIKRNLNLSDCNENIEYSNYESELQIPDIMKLIQKDLSEPYSIYTYRYFIHNWPHLCFMVRISISYLI